MKKGEAKSEEYEKSLAIGPPTVQGEYDRNFSRLGPKFVTGNGQCAFFFSNVLSARFICCEVSGWEMAVCV